MYRHQLRFVLRFGVRGQFIEFIDKLNAAETGAASVAHVRNTARVGAGLCHP